MADVRLAVNGRAYGGWTSVRVTRGIEAIAGSFDLTASERWSGQDEPWPVRDEDECVITIDDSEPLITGFVDVTTRAYDAESHVQSFSGRDRTGALVDCSAVLRESEFANLPLQALCAKLAAPFGITVSLQEGLADRAISLTSTTSTGKPLSGGAPSRVGSAGTSSSMRIGTPVAKLTINPGESPFEIIDRACRLVGVLPVSDGHGGLVLTRAGGARATTALVEGENILSARATYDGSGRYRRYIVSGQSSGSDDVPGPAAAAVKGEAEDLQVRRAARVLLVRPDGAVTIAFARQRAAWEATVRAARAATFQVTVQGWHQADGTLWPINARVQVRSPFMGVDGELLITQTEFSLSEQGTTTTLQMTRVDGFIPESVLVRPKGGSSALDSILGGP